MSVLHESENANHTDHRRPPYRLITIIALLIASPLLLWIASSHEDHAADPSSPPQSLIPYKREDALDAHDMPPSSTYATHTQKKSSSSISSPTFAPPTPDLKPLAPNPFFPADSPPPPLTIPLSEPPTSPQEVLPEFSEQALANQDAALGPRQWMAQLPDDTQLAIDTILDASSQKVASALDEQEREQMLYAEALTLITREALSCAHHQLSPRARIVITLREIRLLNAHGRLFGPQITANIPAGGKAMQQCLHDALDGRHFALTLDDTRLHHTSFAIGDAR